MASGFPEGAARGGCLCGKVRYHVEGPLRPVVACHCVQCRKTSGHYVAATSAPRTALQVTGEPRWYQSSASARRAFCPTCGSQLFWEGNDAHISIFAGTLDGPTGLETAGHIYCAWKGDYYVLADGLPQAAGHDDDITGQGVT